MFQSQSSAVMCPFVIVFLQMSVKRKPSSSKDTIQINSETLISEGTFEVIVDQNGKYVLLNKKTNGSFEQIRVSNTVFIICHHFAHDAVHDL